MSALEFAQPAKRFQQRFFILITALMPLALARVSASGQEPAGPAPVEASPRSSPQEPATSKPDRPTVWTLTVKGGIFMIPIFGCSIVVVAFIIERFIGLRRKKIIPPDLLRGLEKLTSQTTGIDPRAAYRMCQQHNSPMSNVLRAALLKTGRPHSEVEKAVEDAGAREAAAMFARVRPLNICTSVGPLLGLIGTVQGMIMAFIVTSTTTATGMAKAQELAQGIYTALVTTFAGLCVAIPGVLFAHYFEGVIDRLVREMEEIMLDILPHLERFEGKGRIQRVIRKTGADGAREEPSSAEGLETASPPVASGSGGPGGSGIAMAPGSST